MSTDRPIGKRFSHVYLTPRSPQADSPRMRRRLARAMADFNFSDFAYLVESELGVDVPYGGSHLRHWEAFFETCEIRDVLDTLTLFYRRLNERDERDNDFAPDAPNWISLVDRILREEGSSYAIDEKGGVHYGVDAEFAHNNNATIATISSARYSNVRTAFEAVSTALDHMPPDGKSAVRATFFAAEGLFKLIFPLSSTLAADAISNQLIPRLREIHGDDQSAATASSIIARSFREWVAAAHQYRHEPGTQEPAQVPISLAVLMVSQGASYIRWLAEIDQLRTPT